MILTSDIQKVVASALDAQAVFTGKSHANRGPDAPVYPYVVFRCKVVRTEYTSGPVYYQWWDASAAVYARLGTTPAVIDVLKALAAALAAGTPAVVAALRNSGEAVESVMVKDTEEDYEEALNEGQDVLVASMGVELLCRGDRSVP